MLDRLRSPLFLASGENTASTESVSGDAYNPAASGLKQRIHVNSSYAAIVGDGEYEGHAGNLGASFPTPVGVFTGSVDLATADYAAMDIGQRGGLNLSFAKDLYPNLLFGMGLRGQFGSNGGETAFGGGLDLGAIHIIGPVGALPELRWGVALQQIGYGFHPVEGTTGSPSPFTLAADIDAKLVETDAFDWRVHTGFSLPSFQNLRYRVGTQAQLFDRFAINVGWGIDLEEQTDGDRPTGSVLPSVGLTARFQTGSRSRDNGMSDEQWWNQSEVAVHGSWAPVYDVVWIASGGANIAFGVTDRTAPRITYRYDETDYISPNNDGAADELAIPLVIEDERFVSAWSLDVRDEDGEVVRRIENKELRPENEGLQNVIDRFLYRKTGVEIPAAIVWDGRTETGSAVPDGTYSFVLRAVDDNGNVRETEQLEIVVDNTPPDIVIDAPTDPDDLVFSPNDDGSKDTIVIAQQSSAEDLWLVEILDTEDTPVFSREFVGAGLDDIEWAGTDAAGVLLPDGVYTYRASATDRADNNNSAVLANIIIDTEPTPVGLTVDIGAFSPNGDNVRDAVELTPDVPITAGLRRYAFEVVDGDGTLVRQESGEGVPEPWIFDGRGNENAVLPEGSYQVRLTLEYRNGNRPFAEAPPLTLDVTPPSLTVRSDTNVFSPNGDGNLDTVGFVHAAEEIPVWRGTISAIDGEAESVREYSWAGRPDDRLIWDGRGVNGELLSDGRYRYQVVGTDRAGNTTTSASVVFELDTRETPVFVSTGRGAFSPNSDGVLDQIEILPVVEDRRGVNRFFLDILDAENRVVASIRTGGSPETSYSWDGRGADGRTVIDGAYRVRLAVEYRHGNRPVVIGNPFVVDTRPPEVFGLQASAAIFSPNGDGAGDTIEFRQNSTPEIQWTAAILPSNSNRALRTWQLSGSLEDLIWDGTDDDGDLVPDGRYRYRVSATDLAGNSTSATTGPFRTDTADVEIHLRVSELAISPNGDGIKDTVVFTPVVSTISEIENWRFSVIDANGDPVWERAETGELPTGGIPWSGETTTGRAPDSTYRGRVAIVFARGDTPEVTSQRRVRVDRVAPSAVATLSSTVISPNGDNRLDSLEISQSSSEEQRWDARILSASGQVVATWEWIGTVPELLPFAGLDEQRRRIADGTYRYELSATDEAGNTGGADPLDFTVFTAETPLQLVADSAAFSPNGDGRRDTIRLRPELSSVPGLERFEFAIRDRFGEAVFVREGTAPPTEFAWNGRGPQGDAPEGRYTAEITLSYRHGNQPLARSVPFDLDRTAPDLSARIETTVFSPDNDGNRDEVRIIQSSDPAVSWDGTITGPGGTVVRSFTWSDRAESFSWDGSDVAGNVLPDGIYSYEIAGEDAAGNRSEVRIEDVRIDTRGARLFITLDRRLLSPNDDGTDDELALTLITSRNDGAELRELEIINGNGEVVQRFASEDVVRREQIAWDGRDEAGRVVDGSYRARYRIRYDNGAQPVTLSPEFVLDTAGPALDVVLGGLPFSPDNDGLNDELEIGLIVEDISDIAEWSFAILDRNERPFQSFDGTGDPRDTLVWNGRGTTGETVISAEDYPFRFRAVDETGNESTIRGVIPIDILVVRDGDRLRIQISNINFEPNSPTLALDTDSEAGQKNLSVLDRLVEVFAKYASYEIRVEGHAVNLTGTDREEQEELVPLSTARAETVREALIDRGMAPGRISIVGRGGTEPLVPHTDVENRWKNRRVEFILIR